MTAQDLRVPFALIQDPFGVPASVTRPAPDDTPLTATVVWMNPSTIGHPDGSAFQRREPIHVVSIARSEVPSLPRGTRLVAPLLLGGPSETWVVDEMVMQDADTWSALVLRS